MKELLKMEHGCYHCRVERHLKECLILMVLLTSCFGFTTEATVEKLFTDALREKGQAYLEIRQNILDLAAKDNSYLKEKSESTDLQTRVIAQAILGRAENPQEYQHFEELMIVPITQATKYGAMTVIGARPFETIKRIVQDPTGWDGSSSMMPRELEKSAQETFQSYCHDESAFLFLAEMALKDSMLDVPKLSEQIEWTDDQKTYSPNEVAEMLGVLPKTAQKWHKAGLFLLIDQGSRDFFPVRPRSGVVDVSAPIYQSQVRTFYQFYSDKIINPAYLRSKEPVSRVVHSDIRDAVQRFQQDPGSLFRCYAVLMIREFDKPENPGLLYDVYKQDASDYVRAYCVEGFSAKTQVDQIRQSMKDSSGRVQREAVIKSRENLNAFKISDYLQLISPEKDSIRRFDPEVVRILAEKNDPCAIEPLIGLLECGGNNYAVAKALIAIDPNSIFQALEHQNPKIRCNTWSTLIDRDIKISLKKDYLVEYFSRFEKNSDTIFAAIYPLSTIKPDFLIYFLENKNPSIRKRALELLSGKKGFYSMKEDSVNLKDLFISYLNDASPEVRRTALRALCGYRYEKDVYKILLDALNDDDAEYRKTAVRYGNIDVRTLDVLLSRETDRDVRIAAIFALTQSSEPSRCEVLIKHINDKDPEVRVFIASELGGCEDEQSIKALKTLLEDADTDVQCRAVESIAEIDVELLLEIISDLQPKQRQAAYASLREVETDKAINQLIKGTEDEDADVRRTALWSLYNERKSYESSQPAVSAVQKCLQDDIPQVREYAIYTLYKMIGDNSLKPISGCLYDSEKSVKRSAIQTLGRSKSRLAVKYLMDALAHEEDKEILVEMVRALQEITGNLLTKDEWMQWWEENKSTYFGKPITLLFSDIE